MGRDTRRPIHLDVIEDSECIAAHAVVRGAMHVFTDVEPAMRAVVGRRLHGVPFCEAFAEPEFQKFRELYDWARKYRETVAFSVMAPNGEAGIVTLRPLGPDALDVTFEPALAYAGLRLATPTSYRVTEVPERQAG